MAGQVYEVGVGIALSGNTAKLVQQLAAEFAKLDEIAGGFNKTLSSTNEAMRLLTSSSKSLAGTWRDLAASAEKFSRASRAAGTPGRGGVLRRSGGASSRRTARAPALPAAKPWWPIRSRTRLPKPSGAVCGASVIQPSARHDGAGFRPLMSPAVPLCRTAGKRGEFR